MRDLVFIDCETTGLEPDYHEIIEIAAARVDPGTLVIRREMDAKIQPAHPERVDPEAVRKNGYTPDRWLDALSLDEALDRLSPILNGAVLAGHNVAFDRMFIEAAYHRAEQILPDIDYHLVDTASLAWPLVVAGIIERPSLRFLCEHFGISNEGAHSAPADVRRTIAVYRELMSLFGERSAESSQGEE